MTKLIALLTLVLLFGCTANQNPKVFISTEMGDIIVELYADKAPITTANFLQYVDSEKFNGVGCFYRVVRPDNQPNNPIKIEVVQGGFAIDSLIEKKQLLPIKHENTKETSVLHLDGTISMARLEPGTASSEFFICIGDQPELDFGGKRNPDGQGFAAFGRVIEGMDVVKKIQQLEDNEQYLKKPVFIIEIMRM
ncbi:MAG: peptidylprolyl isomerase [Bacteroidales bacterium]